MPTNVINNLFIRLSISLLLLGSGSEALAINLTAQVDRESITMNESLRLVVAVDESASDSIDFSQLESQFDIINQQRSQRQQIINGRISALTQWILVLAPKEPGNLLIPSFRYQGVFSNPIEITVNESKPHDSSQADSVFLEITADKNEAYVQEQVLLKTRLYYKISLSSYEAPEFKLKDTTIELVNETTYKSTLNNERYQVLELIHAVYPQASGELVIPQLRWRLEKPSRGFFDRSGNPYLFVQSNELRINVKPIPNTSTAPNWLPSEAVTLTPEWKQSPLQAKVGEPLNLTITLTANGLSAAQLPQISLADRDNLEIFSEPSVGDDIKSGSGIIGSRTNEFAIIPQQTGTIDLPPVNVKWWNTNLGKEQIATLPAQRLVVGASQLQQESLPTFTEALTPTTNTPASTSTHSSFWQAISFVLVLLCAGLCYWIYRLKQISLMPVDKNSSLPDSSNNDLSTKSLEKEIEETIKSNTLGNLPTLLIHWARDFFDDQSIRRCEDIVHYIPALADDIKQLNQSLYGSNPPQQWNAMEIIEKIKSVGKKRKAKPIQALKPLYPSGH